MVVFCATIKPKRGNVLMIYLDNAATTKMKDSVMEEVKRIFKPEFLNRIDETVMFEPLGRKAIEKIVDIQLTSLREMLHSNGIELIYTAAARNYIADAGFDALYGARPIKRTIQREVVNTLSKRILAGAVDRTRSIRLDADDEGLRFEN